MVFLCELTYTDRNSTEKMGNKHFMTIVPRTQPQLVLHSIIYKTQTKLKYSVDCFSFFFAQ